MPSFSMTFESPALQIKRQLENGDSGSAIITLKSIESKQKKLKALHDIFSEKSQFDSHDTAETVYKNLVRELLSQGKNDELKNLILLVKGAIVIFSTEQDKILTECFIDASCEDQLNALFAKAEHSHDYLFNDGLCHYLSLNIDPVENKTDMLSCSKFMSIAEKHRPKHWKSASAFHINATKALLTNRHALSFFKLFEKHDLLTPFLEKEQFDTAIKLFQRNPQVREFLYEKKAEQDGNSKKWKVHKKIEKIASNIEVIVIIAFVLALLFYRSGRLLYSTCFQIGFHALERVGLSLAKTGITAIRIMSFSLWILFLTHSKLFPELSL